VDAQQLLSLLNDITEHARSLNNDFIRLENDGFRVRVSGSTDNSGQEHLSVRVWKEEELLRTE